MFVKCWVQISASILVVLNKMFVGFSVSSGNWQCPEIKCKKKVKVQFTLEQATKAQKGGRIIAPLFL